MPITVTRSKIKHEIDKTLKQLNTKRAYIRVVVTRGEGEITLDPQAATTNNLVIITKEMSENPRWWYENGVEVIIANTRRTSAESVDPSAKSGNYLNNILAFNEAKKLGAFDAIMLNHENFVTEGTTSNIWIVKEGTLITPPLKAGLLGGITRSKIIEIASSLSLTVKEENITEKQLKASDEVFLTSSTKRVVPIIRVDKTDIGNGKPGKVWESLFKAYLKSNDLPY